MNSKKSNISPVKNNFEKYLSIKEINERYNKAKKYEFYYECLWLTYSLIEDRTKAILYHIGFLNSNREIVISNKNVKESVIKILEIDKEKPKYNFSKLYYRLEHIIKIQQWLELKNDADNEYEKYLREKITKYFLNEDFKTTIDYLQNEWKDIRNELTHALCDKKVEAVTEKLKELSNMGYECFKILNKTVAAIKKCNVRHKFKLQ